VCPCVCVRFRKSWSAGVTGKMRSTADLAWRRGLLVCLPLVALRSFALCRAAMQHASSNSTLTSIRPNGRSAPLVSHSKLYPSTHILHQYEHCGVKKLVCPATLAPPFASEHRCNVKRSDNATQKRLKAVLKTSYLLKFRNALLQHRYAS
jgi:hypothetical protein